MSDEIRSLTHQSVTVKPAIKHYCIRRVTPQLVLPILHHLHTVWNIQRMKRTPWSKQNSSIPSDRIKPSPKPSVNTSTSTKKTGKGKQQQPGEPPKSKEVIRLEDLLQRVQNVTGGEKDPKGGCFCLGAYGWFLEI